MIDLVAIPSSLNVSLWVGGITGTGIEHGVPQVKVFDFASPKSFQVGLNRFTAPAGSFAYPNVNYFIVLSGFGSSLSIRETTSGDEDPFGEALAILRDDSRVRALDATGPWLRQFDPDSGFNEIVAAPVERSSVLRLAVLGSERDHGILASGFAQPPPPSPSNNYDQETISAGDDCCFEIGVGAADRYLIRGVALLANDSTLQGGFFGIEFNLDLDDGDAETDDTLFTLPFASARSSLIGRSLDSTATGRVKYLTGGAGINEWTAPRGATVAGGGLTYVLDMDIRSIPGDIQDSTRGGAVLGQVRCVSGHDPPRAPGVTLSEHGDISCLVPMMAVVGEPLEAMVSNLGQDDDSFTSFGSSTRRVVSQGFRTGSAEHGYRLQGIGVNINGSVGMNSTPQLPGGPSSVSVSVHEDVNGSPGAKLFDLISPDEYAPGVSFFEAPPDTALLPDTSYVMVWRYLSGAWHRLVRTASDDEDAGGLTDFRIADAFRSGADLTSLSEDTDGYGLELAVYGEAGQAPVAAPEDLQVEPPAVLRHAPEVGTLVSNLGQDSLPAATITQQYAQQFRLGGHGQGYALSSVSIDLAAVPSSLGVSLWIGGVPEVLSNGVPQRKVFDFINPESLEVGLNRFAAPPGAFAYQNVNYYIVLSDFGSSLSIRETNSSAEDAGGGAGSALGDDSLVRALTATGSWIRQLEMVDEDDFVEVVAAPVSRGSVLRLAVHGSRRAHGILASTYGPRPPTTDYDQETISAGDDCCFEMGVGAADRYLIRGVSVLADDTTSTGGFFGIEFNLDLDDGDADTDDTLFTLPFASARPAMAGRVNLEGATHVLALSGGPGISEWTAPQGATVAGDNTYTFAMDVRSIHGDNPEFTRGGVSISRTFCLPPAAGTTRRGRRA